MVKKKITLRLTKIGLDKEFHGFIFQFQKRHFLRLFLIKKK